MLLGSKNGTLIQFCKVCITVYIDCLATTTLYFYMKTRFLESSDSDIKKLVANAVLESTNYAIRLQVSRLSHLLPCKLNEVIL